MNSFRAFALSLPLTLLLASSVPVYADAIFTFDDVTAGSITPFTSTANGLSASFSGPASVCDVSGANFSGLSGNAVIQDFCNPPQLGAVSISFSSNVSSVSFNFATAFSPSGSLTLEAFENSTSVGTSVFTSSVPPGNFPNGEGVASFSGLFNNVVLTPSSILAVDNLSATTAAVSTPEPASFWSLLAGLSISALFLRRSRALNS